MPLSDFDTDSHELIKFRIRGVSGIFLPLRNDLRICNDIDTIALRIIGRIGWNRTDTCKISLRFHYDYTNVLGEYGTKVWESITNQLRICRQHIRIKENS